ncbi:MAG: hypothetical protein II553_04990, partial [Lachnospiraceae bacterium]|nr:hypothetical protein [Lachnospiraceae bacterium]
ISGKELETRLDSVHITANKNAVPNDPASPFVTSGLRVGTPAVTSRGLGTEDMTKIGEWIAGARHYYLQPFRESDQVMQKGVFHAPEREDLIKWKELLVKTIVAVDIRGLA